MLELLEVQLPGSIGLTKSRLQKTSLAWSLLWSGLLKDTSIRAIILRHVSRLNPSVFISLSVKQQKKETGGVEERARER